MSQKLSNGNCAVSNKYCGKVDKTSLVVVVQRKNKIKHATDLYSSKDRKRAHESSADVLPPRNSPTDDSTYLQSSYTVDFNKKEGKPACMRPCSVTRRNRPHPLMDFLIPQNIKHKVNKQRFYDDYVGRFSLDCGYQTKDVSCSPIPAVNIDQHRNNMVARQFQRPFSPTTEPQFNMKRASREFEIWMNALKNPAGRSLPEINETTERKALSPEKTNVPLCMTKEAVQNFNKWVKKSTARDRKIVTDLMDAGDRGYLTEFLESTVHPSAIGSMHEWFRRCEDEERNVAMNFLKSVCKLPNVQESKAKQNVPSWSKLHDLRQTDKKYIRTMRVEARKPFKVEGKRTVLEKRPIRNKPGFSYRNKKEQKRQKSFQPKFADYSHIVSNKGAMFMQPHKKLGGHFEIHPEFSASFMV